ncbi:MAG: efflux RND transporter periplasmic adaptor subunit [Bacteroidales bacterium]|jgi:HlyD family secretion protein|nr:efflux RND transporter periplasmic adaptor subunit [Bacteroidales bacterium]
MKTAKQIIFVLMLAFAGYIVYRAVKSSDRAPEETVKPVFREISRKITVPGIIMPSKEIDIKSNISGVLDELFVKVGQPIGKGQAIARILMETNPTEYRQLQKRVEVSGAQFRNSEANYERNLTLFKKNVIAQADIENEEMAYQLAKSEYEAALAELRLADNRPADSLQNTQQNIVIATDNGTLLELPVRAGGPVMARGTFSEGTTIARIARLDALIFRGYVAETDIKGLREGMPLRLIIGALDSSKITGTLSLIAPQGVQRDGITKFEIEAEVNIPRDMTEIIRAGYSANAEIVVKRKENALAVEEKHLHFSGDSIYVETPAEKGKWRKTVITVGISDGIYTEILTGVDTATVIKTYKNP